MKSSLPAINIRWPYSQLIIEGKKSIETRFYALPKAYQAKNIFIIETFGGTKPARIIGIIRFSKCFCYESKKQFQKDFKKHLVDDTSPYYWDGSKQKWAWIIEEVKSVKPRPAPKSKGICWTREVSTKPSDFSL